MSDRELNDGSAGIVLEKRKGARGGLLDSADREELVIASWASGISGEVEREHASMEVLLISSSSEDGGGRDGQMEDAGVWRSVLCI